MAGSDEWRYLIRVAFRKFENQESVEAAVCRQLISGRRPSRDSRYAAFLSIHCAYTLVAHTCVITVIPHMCIQINCTVLNCLPYCLVVYAAAAACC
jgi:hypothetical protein